MADLLVALLLSAGFLGTACLPGQSTLPTTKASRVQALESAPIHLGSLGLCGSQLADPRGRFLVTPRWLPTGEVQVSGKFGVGQYLLAADSHTLQELDADFADSFTTPPVRVRLRDADAYAQVLGKGQTGQVVFEEYRGRIALLDEGSETVLVDSDAWGVRLSPDNRWIAYCKGHLLDSQLNLVSLAGDRVEIGPGAQPAWFPDGRRLAFSVPVASAASDGQPTLVGADLFLYDLGLGEGQVLATHPDLIAMEPALSADGRLAFADWRSGDIVVTRSCDPGGDP